MKTYELTYQPHLGSGIRVGGFCRGNKCAICADFIRYFLNRIPDRILVTVSIEEFPGSKPATFEDDDLLYWVEFDGDGEAHPVYDFPGRILKRLTKNTGGKFHFKIEEAK